MKRFVYILLLVLIVAFAILAMTVVASSNRVQQNTLDAFLNYYEPSEPGIHVIRTARAARPSALTAGMSGPVFGLVTHFSVNVSPGGSGFGYKPLPYPPERIVCLLLQSSRGKSVALLALHGDDYNADWLVHRMVDPWPSAALDAQLAAIGCQFPP